MNKGILAIAIALSVALLGCSQIPDLTRQSSPASTKIVREAKLGSSWEMRQISFEVAAGEKLPILLKLSDGDRVDGYFYLEKGRNVDFQVMANSLVYKSQSPGNAPAGITSDRFSFIASQAQGSSYSLIFSNPAPSTDKEAKVAVFLEVVYPASGSIFNLLGNK